MEAQFEDIHNEISSLKKQVSLLETAKKTQAEIISNLKREMANLSIINESSSTLSPGKHSFVWNLDESSNWRSLLADSKCGPSWLRSSPFYLEDKSYCLEMRLRLKEEVVGVSIHLIQGRFDGNLIWPLSRKFKLSLLNSDTGLIIRSVVISPPNQEDKKIAWQRPYCQLNYPIYDDLSFHTLNNEKNIMLKIELDSGNFSEAKELTVNENWSLLPEGMLMNHMKNGNIILRLEENAEMNSFIYPQRLTPKHNYFEVQILHVDILNETASVGIGLSPPNFNFKSQMPGWKEDTIGFHSDDGCLFVQTGKGTAFGQPSSILDVLGCGIKFSNDQAYIAHDWGETHNDATVDIFFTRNGVRIGDTINMRYPDACLYPAVGLVFKNTEIELIPPYSRRFDSFPVIASLK